MNKKGFTLVELIAVITILGVVLLIAVPSFQKNIDETKRAKCNADEKAIIDAANTYANDLIYRNNGTINSRTTIKVDKLISLDYLKSDYIKYKNITISFKGETLDGITTYKAYLKDSNKESFDLMC